MRIVLIGPPGSGKVNISQRINEEFNLPIITLQGVLKEVASEPTELGKLAKESLHAKRHSDELIQALLRVRFTRNDLTEGFILEAYPCSALQADVLDNILGSLAQPLDLVLQLDIDSDSLMERLVGLIYCDKCGTQYNLYENPPLVENVCDNCGAKVCCRPDDYEENISNKLRVYEVEMTPVINFYRLKNILSRVNANQPPGRIWRDVKRIIHATPVADPKIVEDNPVIETSADVNLKKGGNKRKSPKPRTSKKAVTKVASKNTSKKVTKKVANKVATKKVDKK